MQLQKLADAMLASAATVIGRLVEQKVGATPTKRNDHEGSVQIKDETLVTMSTLPSAADARIIVRFQHDQIGRVVSMMIGGGDDSGEVGAMQLSIISETVSQIATAMTEQLAKDLGVSADGIKAELVSDATQLPPPPFESYEGKIAISAELAPSVAIDFAAITKSKLQGVSVAEAAPVGAGVGSGSGAQSVSFTAMTPTAMRPAHPGEANLELVHDIPLQISAVLGQTAMSLREVVALSTGSVFELDKNSTEPIDLYVNNILIARGEVVVVDDKFAVKISELNPQTQ